LMHSSMVIAENLIKKCSSKLPHAFASDIKILLTTYPQKIGSVWTADNTKRWDDVMPSLPAPDRLV
jgi:hypothetical protein